MSDGRAATERRVPETARALPRPALVARVADALERGGVLLVAPAGFGKTTLLDETLAARPGAAAWVGCTPAHRDPGRLVEEVVARVRAAAPGVAELLGERMAFGLAPVDAEVALRVLGDELERLLVDPLTLVFDAAECLAPAPGALRVVSELAALRPGPLRVAVASRRDLPLAARARLVAAGRLTEFDAADLAFTPQECTELLRRRTGRDPSGPEVEEAWSRTEGWPLAASLTAGGAGPLGGAATGAAAPARAAGPPGTATSPARGVAALAAYLAEEVLDPAGPALRDELVDSSVAPDLDPQMLRALGLREDLPAEAARLGLPLQPAGPDGRLAHHPLVRELLRERLRSERSRERVAALAAACAAALEEAGRGPEAVEHWFASARPADAAAAVARHAPALAATAPATVGAWLDRLRPEDRAAPALRLLEGRLAAGAGRLDAAVAPLREAVDGFAAARDEAGGWAARVALADVLTILERFEEAMPLADGFEHVDLPAAPVVAVSAAAAAAGAGRYADASDRFARAAEHPAAGPVAPCVRGFHGFWVDLECGRLDAARDGVRAAVADLERADPFTRLPYLLGMQAVVHEERGEDERALEAFARAVAVARQAALGGYIEDLGRRFAAGVHARAGRLADADLELAAATATGLGWYARDADVTRAALAVARGCASEAAASAEAAIAGGAFARWRSRRRATAALAPVLVAAGLPGRAAELVDEALVLRPPHASVVRLRALRGWLRWLEGDAAGAVADLAAAWEEAGGEAAHLLRREGARLEPVVWEALRRRVLEPRAVLAAVEAARPGGEAVLRFTHHPLPEVRRAALAATAVSGHPAAPLRIAELERDPEPAVAAAARASRASLAAEPVPLVFRLLGRFAVRRGSHELGDGEWAGRRHAAQRLVRFLLAHRDEAVPEEEVFSALWPGRERDAARRSLQVTATCVRTALEPPGSGRRVLLASGRAYRLVLGPHDVVDADTFERLARRALAARGDGRRVLLEAAAARWGGEPLPEDRYADWAAPWRERLDDMQRRVLAALAGARADAGDVAGAVDAARRWVELDPLDEAAHRQLMVAYVRAGRRGQALRQYLACRRALVDVLAIEPAAETTALQQRVLAGDPL